MPRKRATQKQAEEPSTPLSRSRNRPQRAAAATARSNIISASTPYRRVKFSDNEILSTFRLFVVPATESDDEDDEDEDDDEEAAQLRSEGKMPITDVRRAINALGLPKPPALGELFEPGQRKVGAKDFLALARMLREIAEEQGDEEEGDEEEEEQDWSGVEDDDEEEDEDVEDDDMDGGGGFVREKPKRQRSTQPSTNTPTTQATKAKAKAKGKGRASATSTAEDIDSAYALFKRGGAGPITIADLRRVARELREDVDDAVLRLMLEEANGEAGEAAVRKGVGRGEFEGVMRRAGVFAR